MATLEPLMRAANHAPPINILLIEDDPNDALILHHLLADSGLNFSVLHQHDGADALEYLKVLTDSPGRFRLRFPDIILLDLKMPRVSGIEVLQWLRSQPQFERIPVMVLTGSSFPQDLELSSLHGATEVLYKNADPSDLREQLIHCLRSCVALAC